MMRRFFFLCCAGALALSLGGCAAPSVDVVRVKKQMAPFVYEADVRVEALHTLAVTPQVSGPIISDIPDIGTAIEAGQLLFQIDSSAYEAQRADLAGRMGAAAAAAPAPDDSLEASLLRQGIITRAEYDRLRARRGVPAQSRAPAADEASRIAMQAVEQSIANCTVRAPISGIIARNYVTETKTAAAGQTALVIREDSPVIASLQIPSAMDPILQKAKEKKTLTVTFERDGEGPRYGELKPQPNPGGDPYTVYKVQADNPDGAMEIGASYTVRIDSGQSVEGYVIPGTAFVKDDMVEIVNADNLIDVRTVTVAGSMGEDKLVIGGLEDGDRVVARPSDRLPLGAEVRVR